MLKKLRHSAQKRSKHIVLSKMMSFDIFGTLSKISIYYDTFVKVILEFTDVELDCMDVIS